MDLNLKGKNAFITGGSHGIGQAICVALAQEGCNIIFCSRGQRYNQVETIKLVSKYDVDCVAYKTDVKDFTGMGLILAHMHAHYGGINILVNCAGGGGRWGKEPYHLTDKDTWNEVMEQNFFSMINITTRALPFMLINNFGRIITISSIYGKESGGRPWFQATKSAQISAMKAFSQSKVYVSHNITFNTVCPGYISIPDKEPEPEMINKIPVGHFGTPMDVGSLVTFLASPNASYINGACLTVDGGESHSY